MWSRLTTGTLRPCTLSVVTESVVVWIEEKEDRIEGLGPRVAETRALGIKAGDVMRLRWHISILRREGAECGRGPAPRGSGSARGCDAERWRRLDRARPGASCRGAE